MCKEDGCNPLAGGKKKVDCPLLLMCDLTSFANGNFNLGEGKSWTRAGGREHGVRFW